MTIFIKQGIKVLFIHIPKTGGTTFTDMMTDLGWEPSFYIRGKSLSELTHLKTTPQHYHARLLKRSLNLEEFDLQLAIIRHPFERMKSEFYWQNRKTKGHLQDPEDWLKTTIDNYKNNKYIYDNHIRPQKQFITPETEIFKIEANGIASAISRCQNLIKPQALHGLSQHVELDLPSKGKTTKSENIERKFEGIKKEIINFYQSDFKLWKDLN
jgi:hypothetical protein